MTERSQTMDMSENSIFRSSRPFFFLALIINLFFLYYSVMYIINPAKVPETFVYIVMILFAFSTFMSVIYGLRYLFG